MSLHPLTCVAWYEGDDSINKMDERIRAWLEEKIDNFYTCANLSAKTMKEYFNLTPPYWCKHMIWPGGNWWLDLKYEKDSKCNHFLLCPICGRPRPE